ncbi:MAG: threonine synthase, partial [Helicobacter sp.]|nr:threonine synthase [Helicobacter sp.]
MQSEYFVGSRGGDKTNVSFKQAILSPIAPYGGLWTLKKIPFFSREQRECFADLEYSALTKEIFASLGLEIEDEV